jgi:hypothetical protein
MAGRPAPPYSRPAPPPYTPAPGGVGQIKNDADQQKSPTPNFDVYKSGPLPPRVQAELDTELRLVDESNRLMLQMFRKCPVFPEHFGFSSIVKLCRLTALTLGQRRNGPLVYLLRTDSHHGEGLIMRTQVIDKETTPTPYRHSQRSSYSSTTSTSPAHTLPVLRPESRTRLENEAIGTQRIPGVMRPFHPAQLENAYMGGYVDGQVYEKVRPRLGAHADPGSAVIYMSYIYAII